MAEESPRQRRWVPEQVPERVVPTVRIPFLIAGDGEVTPRIWRGRLLWQLAGLLLNRRRGKVVERYACAGFHGEGRGIELRWIDRRVAGGACNRGGAGDRAAPPAVTPLRVP